MRFHILLAATFAVASATAQNYYVPDNVATVGNCNVIPFGATSLTTWGKRYQTKATAADLGVLPGVITGLGFAPCGSGTIHFDSIEIIFDHHPAGTPLSPTFANNLTANAVTVLSATNYTWIINADTWNEIGLQNFFVFNGVDDLVMQVTCTNSLTTGGPQGFHTGARQRLYWYSTTGPAPASGTLGSSAALKFEVGELMARLSTYGVGCGGSNGTPEHTLSGSAQLQQIVNLDIANGVPNGFGVAAFGFYNGDPPFPLDLGVLGMTGCFQFTDIAAASFVLLDSAGSGTLPFGIPGNGSLIGVRLYSQYGCIDLAANATGVTTSNYGRIFIGN